LHCIADISGFIFDDQLGGRVATQRVGAAGQGDQARPIRQRASTFVVLFEHLGRLEVLEEADDLCEELFGLAEGSG
jgi:hypothetical protein